MTCHKCLEPISDAESFTVFSDGRYQHAKGKCHKPKPVCTTQQMDLIQPFAQCTAPSANPQETARLT